LISQYLLVIFIHHLFQSLDWGKILTGNHGFCHVFTIFYMGVSGFNFPLNQSNESSRMFNKNDERLVRAKIPRRQRCCRTRALWCWSSWGEAWLFEPFLNGRCHQENGINMDKHAM
jgi:hypothetical protein